MSGAANARPAKARSRSRSSTPWIDDPAYVSPWLEFDHVPGPSDPGAFLCGADPGWSPARDVEPGAADRCPRCGKPRVYDGRIEPAIADGENKACGSCAAWGRDAELAARMLAEYARRGAIDPIFQG